MIYVQTFIALLAFAGNSLLSRLALAQNSIDPASFATLRLLSGAVALSLLAVASKQWPGVRAQLGRCHVKASTQWTYTLIATISLTVYMLGFAYAYQFLPAGIGALVLFGAVQVTMLMWGLYRGERLGAKGWFGGLMCIAGVTFLTVLGDVEIARAQWWLGAALMIAAGIAWGSFSLVGRQMPKAMIATTSSFILSTFIALVVWAIASTHHYTQSGVIYAILSGALTSGVGYFVWYRVLPSLSAINASVVQLATPVLVGLLGIVLLSEPLTSVFWLGALLVLGGLSLVLTAKR